jgi:hypothetical protein
MFGEPPGSDDLCTGCGWEDDGLQLANPTTGGGANRESLVEAQAAARRRDWPSGATRDPAWRPVSDQEIAWYRSDCEAKGSWPNPPTDPEYWRAPFERVYTVPDWYDGPVAGIADYRGSPHRFRRRWDAPGDECAPDFELEPVSEPVLALETALWSQWVRWLDAFDAGHTDLSTHPCLPEDRSAHEAIAAELAGIAPSSGSIVAKGTFRGNLRRCTDARVRWEPAVDERR